MSTRIGLVGDNSIEYIKILLDIWNRGDCAVLIDWRIPFNKIVEMLHESSVTICYIDKILLEANDYTNCHISFIKIEKKYNRVDLLPREIHQKFISNYSDNEAIILFSSGTTGKAKGIILSHFAINKNADSILNYMKLTPRDSLYIVKSLAHSSTLTGELIVGLKSKIKILISPTIISPSLVLNNLEKYKITNICINPTLLMLYSQTQKIKRYNLELRAIYTSGAIADKELIKESEIIFENCKVFNVYGLTEAGPRVTAQTPSSVRSIGSVGRPIEDVNIIIVDEQGHPLPPIKKGIIHINTACKSSGYISNIPARKSLYKDWINTGDIGYIDYSGNLYISGREDNMIIVGGHNVYPEEVENVIGHFNKIKDCVVFGVKDYIYGQRIICHYVCDNDISSELYEYCKCKLAMYEIPKKFIKVDSILQTENNKKIRTHFQYE